MNGGVLRRALPTLVATALLAPTLAIAAPTDSLSPQTDQVQSTSLESENKNSTSATQRSDLTGVSGTQAVANNPMQTSTGLKTDQSSTTAASATSGQPAPIQMTSTPRSDSSIKDMLDTDDARVTRLYQTDRQTGTAPFDEDDSPGNDSGRDNNVVRSYDSVAYTYSFNVDAKDSSHYYRRARVGFRFELAQPQNAVTFDLDQMGWVDGTPGYQPRITTETIGGVPTQVLTAYRLLTPSSSVPTVIPGSSTITLVVKVKGATNGTTFSPQITSWAAPDTTTMTDPAHDTPEPVRVSARLNLNLRITDGVNENSDERIFDFNREGAQSYVNHELGKVKGIISKFNWAVDMRWPDRSKGLKGLEAPSGPITFSLSASDLWQKSNGELLPSEGKLQPYLWDFGTIDGDFNNAGRRTQDQGWNPRFDNYSYARSTGGQVGKDRVRDNGSYTVSQTRKDDKTIFTLTLKNYQVGNTFPLLGHTYSPGTNCSPALASSDCTEIEVGEISTGYLYVFNPTTIDGVGVADHYGESGLSLQSKVRDGGLEARSVTGQSLAAASGPEDTSNQALPDDDEWNSAMYTQGSGTSPGISNIIQYSCLSAPNYFDNGVDCGWWGAPDNLGGTDSAMTGTQVRIMAGFNFHTSKADLPLLSLSLIKIDPSVIDLPETADLDLPWSGNGIWQNASNDATGDPNHNLTVVKYATKPDGSTWANDKEQNDSDIGDLLYYDSKAQAEAHGTIVAILLGGRTAAPTPMADKDSRYGFGGFKVTVRPQAKIGSVAQLTSTSHTYTRNQLASLSGLDPSHSSDQEWENWARTQDPDLLLTKITPHFTTPKSSYQKARYDATRGYLGGDSGGNQLGDSLYVTGEQPTISKSVEQTVGGSTPKTNFDLDADQRFVDWRLTAHVSTNASQSNKDNKTDIYITDTLPKKMTYLPGSARLGGTYQERTPENGLVTGGKACEPSISTDSQGRTVLSWTLTGIPTDSTRTIIHYTAFIGDLSAADNDVNNGEILETASSIMSKRNMAKPSTFKGTVSKASIRVSRYHTTSLFASTPQLINEVNAPISFNNMLGNFSSTPKDKSWAVDVLPWQRGGSQASFHGTYSLNDLTVSATGPTDLNYIGIYYTTDTKWQVNDPASIRPEVFTTWTEAEIDTNTGRVSVPENTVAWAFIIKRQPPNSRYDFTFSLLPKGGMPADAYQNRWGNETNQVPATALVAKRTVSGIVWYDHNGDGIRSASDTPLKGVEVSLLDDSNNPVMSTTDPNKPIRATTDEKGAYTLTEIPAGHYHLLFNQAKGSDWSGLQTTKKQAPGASRTEDSSAQSLIEGGIMTGAVISLDNFPKAEDMAAVTYAADFNNCGLTGPLATDQVSVTLGKNLTGRDWTDQDIYTLQIEAIGGAPPGVLPETVHLNSLHRQVQVPLNTAVISEDGTYHYQIKEENGHQPGLTYDTETINLTISVTSHPDQLKRVVQTRLTTASGKKIDSAIFTNSYRPQATSISPTVGKELRGRSIKEGEFSFELIDKETGQRVSRAANDAEGRVTFPAQTLRSSGRKRYLVREIQGHDATITYDRSQYELDIDVIDHPAQGLLTAEQVGDRPTFVNVFTPAGSREPDKPLRPVTPPDSVSKPQAGQPPVSGNPDKRNQSRLSATGTEVGVLLILSISLTAIGASTIYLINHRRQSGSDE